VQYTLDHGTSEQRPSDGRGAEHAFCHRLSRAGHSRTVRMDIVHRLYPTRGDRRRACDEGGRCIRSKVHRVQMHRTDDEHDATVSQSPVYDLFPTLPFGLGRRGAVSHRRTLRDASVYHGRRGQFGTNRATVQVDALGSHRPDRGRYDAATRGVPEPRRHPTAGTIRDRHRDARVVGGCTRTFVMHSKIFVCGEPKVALSAVNQH